MPLTVKSVAGDHRVLALLDQKPKTTGEITRMLRREVWESWAEENGYEITWDDQYGMPNDPLIRLLSFVSAEERGFVSLNTSQVYARLRKFEKQGLAQRISVPGRKSILWLAGRKSEDAT